MNVLPATPKLQPTPASDGVRSAPEQLEPGLSFGEILAAALAQGAALCVPRDEPARVDIGDDAVRFDARPVVAASFTPGPPLPAPPESAAAIPCEPGENELPSLQALERVLRGDPARIEHKVAGTASWSAPTAPLPSRPSGPAAPGGAAPSGEARAPLRAPPLPEVPSATAPAPALDASKSEAEARISLTVAADEVLVTVRDIDLTLEEMEALAGELRDLLASTGFGARTLRVVTARRT